MEVSRSSINVAMEDDQNKKARNDKISAVYRIIVDHARLTNAVAVSVTEVLGKVLSRGLKSEHFDQCLDEYKEIGVWFISADRQHIRFVQQDA